MSAWRIDQICGFGAAGVRPCPASDLHVVRVRIDSPARAPASPAPPSASRAPRPAAEPAPPRPGFAPAMPAAPLPAAGPSAAPSQPGPRGVPLGSLAACVSDRREDELKLRLMAGRGDAGECASAAGRCRFVQTLNRNAFLTWVERAPSRRAADRCVEFSLALECLAQKRGRSRET